MRAAYKRIQFCLEHEQILSYSSPLKEMAFRPTMPHDHSLPFMRGLSASSS